MKHTAWLLILTMLCTSCTALPAEERAFAVALAVEREGDTWRVHARIPTYQTGGGYLTVAGEGADLPAAMADLEANSPMHLHLSQLRLLAVDRNLAEEGVLEGMLNQMAERSDLRQQCAVAVCEASAVKLMEALKPAAGARLSKAIDVMLDTRAEQGVILPSRLADVICMGERQSPVLIALAVEDGSLELSGGYAMGKNVSPGLRINAEEVALLSMMMGEAKTLRQSFGGQYAEVRVKSVRVHLSPELQEAHVQLTLRTNSSVLSAEGLERHLAGECLALLGKLSSKGCDVLGLGRQAVLRVRDMAQWHDLRWPERLKEMTWRVSVCAEGMT